MKIIELRGTTAVGGALVITGTKKVTGFIERIDYDYVDAATGADITIVTTGQAVSAPVLIAANIGTADKTWFPRSLGSKSTDGAAFTDVAEKIYLANESLKCTVAEGGDGKVLRFLVYVSNEGAI
jgi:hypothetical protein